MQCLPCTKGNKLRVLEASPKTKALSNVKAHLKNLSHKNNVVKYLQNKEKNDASVKKVEDLKRKESTF